MENLQNLKTYPSVPNYHLSLLSGLHEADIHTDTNLCSDGQIVSVHSAILAKCSEVFCEILDSMDTKLIILPGFSPILSDFVSLVYTGQVSNLTKQGVTLLTSLCAEPGFQNKAFHNEKDFGKTANTLHLLF